METAGINKELVDRTREIYRPGTTSRCMKRCPENSGQKKGLALFTLPRAVYNLHSGYRSGVKGATNLGCGSRDRKVLNTLISRIRNEWREIQD